MFPEYHVPPIQFRRLEEPDLSLMHRWLNTPHVDAWYGEAGDYESIATKYLPYITGEKPTEPYLILYGDTPIGYIQAYLIDDYPGYARHLALEAAAAGIDLFIGEGAFIHHGLGPLIIRAFLRIVVFERYTVQWCVIGPHMVNFPAIRAYEKAGFHYLKTVHIPGEATPEYIMIIDRRDVMD